MLRQTGDSQIEAVLDLALGVAVRTGLSVYDASDVAQEVAIAYLTGDSRPADNWKAWVTTVARNRTIDVLRKRGGGALVVDQPDDGDAYEGGRYNLGPSVKAITEELVDSLLSGLSERDRTILALDAMGMGKAEIAKRVGLANANSASVTLSRIKKRLRDEHPHLVGDLGHPRLY